VKTNAHNASILLLTSSAVKTKIMLTCRHPDLICIGYVIIVKIKIL